MAISLAEKPVYARTINVGVGILNAASAGALGADTNGVTVYTAGSNGGRIESLVASTDDTAAVNLFVYLKDGSSNIYPLGIVNVPLSSGNSGTVSNVDMLDGSGVRLNGMCIDQNGKRYVSIPASWTLRVSTLANMTAAKKCHVVAQGFDYTSLS
jgi:hypothetical protein